MEARTLPSPRHLGYLAEFSTFSHLLFNLYNNLFRLTCKRSISLNRSRHHWNATMSERLCAVCNRIFTYTIPQWRSTSSHHSKPGDLLQAANDGCYICRWVTKCRDWNDVSYLFSKGFPVTFEVRSHVKFPEPSSRLSGRFEVMAICRDINDVDCHRRLHQALEDLNNLRKKRRYVRFEFETSPH